MSLHNYYYLFFILILICSLCVILSTNPVQSVYFLILVFAFTSILFVILGADFLAILIIIVYVGAVSILFLFVVMMLNLRVFELYNTFNSYFPIGGVLGLFILFEFIYLLHTDLNFVRSNNFLWSGFFSSWSYNVFYTNNIGYLGYVLYTFYNYLVLIASLILLVSMVGSIVLTVDFEYRNTKRDIHVIKHKISEVSLWFNNKGSKK